MFEQARFNNFDLFAHVQDMTDEQLVAKYTMFLSSQLDARFEWFYKDLVSMNQLDSMLINEDDFETMIGYFRTACIKNGVSKPKVVNFLEYLTNHKEYLVINPLSKKGGGIMSGLSSKNQSLSDSLEQEKKFDLFIERFFQSIADNQVL